MVKASFCDLTIPAASLKERPWGMELVLSALRGFLSLYRDEIHRVQQSTHQQ